MNRFASLCALVAGVAASSGTNAQTTNGSTPSPADTSRLIEWTEGAPGADHVWKDGVQFESITHAGITVTAAVVMGRSVTSAVVGVYNGSTQRVDVLPGSCSLMETWPNQKWLKYKSPTDVANSIQNRALWGAALLGMAGALSQTTTTSTTVSSGAATGFDNNGNSATMSATGVSTTTTSAPDIAARERANQQAELMELQAGAAANTVLRVALENNSLQPGEQVSGLVFFGRDKHAESWELHVPINGVTFVFPFRGD